MIAVLGIADLITTIVFIEHHGAEEANPLFRHLWEMGLFAFISAKLLLIACPLMVLEWARKRRPLFTMRALRGAIAAYIMLYGIGFVRLNGPEAQAGELHVINRLAPAGEHERIALEAARIAMLHSGKRARSFPEKNLREDFRIQNEKQRRMREMRAIQKREWFMNPHSFDTVEVQKAQK